MTNYYALWIPSYQEEVPTIQRDKLDEVILRDIPGSDTIRLKGEMEDHETETDFVRSRLSENLPKSIYHYFKEFFHIHRYMQ